VQGGGVSAAGFQDRLVRAGQTGVAFEPGQQGQNLAHMAFVTACYQSAATGEYVTPKEML
jgi:hypothetical protein